MTDDEPRLRETFQVQRARERARAPAFRDVLQGRPGPGHRSPAIPAFLAVAIAGLVLLLVSLGRTHARRAEAELAREVMSWRSPTEFLLPAWVPGLLPSVLRLDEAPPGSPLKALDHGGAFGPPNNSRSPRS